MALLFYCLRKVIAAEKKYSLISWRYLCYKIYVEDFLQKARMVRLPVQNSILSALLLLAFTTLLTGCAGTREQTLSPAYPEQLYNCAAGWNYNIPYAYVRTFDPFDPYYCDPFLGEPFCSHYYSIHDPYWYYYNAYFYPYQSYYPYYYGYYYNDDDHHHKRGFWHRLKHRPDKRKDARDNRVNKWREKRNDSWDEIRDAIRDRRDARLEQWQGIQERAQGRREERSERWGNFLNNAGNSFSRIGEQRQERMENQRVFFKERSLLRNNNHQPLFKRGDNNTGSGNKPFNGGILRGWGGRR
jgi:hypothetical protein